MTNSDKIAKILEIIKAGNTVYFTTYLKSYSVNQKTVDKFATAGHELFKANDGGIYMMNGKSYLCLNGCEITYTS